MARFAAALSQHPVPAEAVGEVVGQVLDDLAGAPVDLAVLFVSPHYVGAVDDIAATVRTLLGHGADPGGVLLGCTTAAVIGGAREIEDAAAVSLFAAHLPDATLTPVHLHVARTPEGPALVGWPGAVPRNGTFLTLADPFSFPGDAFLDRVNEAVPDLRVVGGLASAARGPGGNRLVLDDVVTPEGAVGVLVNGGIEVATVVSQGCRPIGEPWVVTRAERNVIHDLAGRPALERLQETVDAMTPEERALLQGGLHIGIVVDEHQSEFDRGDFLIRNVMGVDREEGAVAVGDFVDVGRTVQFHVRDAASADEDLREMLTGTRADAALVFTCNGRGRHLFGEPDHDASVINTMLGPLPTAGMFCGGELGPVGGRNFLHGFTASVALLRG